jgi:hypothetical protein
MPLANPWATSTNELAFIFHDALIALAPIAERARMSWQEPNNYDDWDSMAAAIYKSIVIGSLGHAAEWENFDALPEYDERISSYSDNSFLTALEDKRTLAFVCFETISTPFDTCLFARLNNEGEVLASERRSFSETRLLLAGRSGATVRMIDSVQVRL